MSFATHNAKVKYYCDALKDVESPTNVQKLLYDILEYLQNNCHHFEKSVSKSTPFYGEFFKHIKDAHVHHEACFALLECLIIFCRERQLQGLHTQLPELEQQLLHFYEQSHHWHCDEESIIQVYYWQTLPEQYKMTAPSDVAELV